MATMTTDQGVIQDWKWNQKNRVRYKKKKHKKKKPPLGVGIFGIFGFNSLPIRRAEFSDLIQAEA
jgi:hypothetical protein